MRLGKKRKKVKESTIKYSRLLEKAYDITWISIFITNISPMTRQTLFRSSTPFFSLSFSPLFTKYTATIEIQFLSLPLYVFPFFFFFFQSNAYQRVNRGNVDDRTIYIDVISIFLGTLFLFFPCNILYSLYSQLARRLTSLGSLAGRFVDKIHVTIQPARRPF